MKRLNMPVQNWKSVVAGLLAAAISTASPAMAGDILVNGTDNPPTSYETLEAAKAVGVDGNITFTGSAATTQTLSAAMKVADKGSYATLIDKLGATTPITIEQDTGGDFFLLFDSTNASKKFTLSAYSSVADTPDPNYPSHFTIKGFEGSKFGAVNNQVGGAIVIEALDSDVSDRGFRLGDAMGGLVFIDADRDNKLGTLELKENSVAVTGINADGSAYGGAIYSAGMDVILGSQKNIFTGNSATIDKDGNGRRWAAGGAIFSGGDVFIDVGIATFENNSVLTADKYEVYARGGAIAAENLGIATYQATFKGNTATAAYNVYGGALAVVKDLDIYIDTMLITNPDAKITFTNNQAIGNNAEAWVYGGAIAVLNGTLKIGAERLNDPAPQNRKVIFEGNKAESIAETDPGISVARGGAIYSGSKSDNGSHVLHTEFKGNEVVARYAAHGGAIYFTESALTLSDTLFEANKVRAGVRIGNDIKGIIEVDATFLSAGGGAVAAGGLLTLSGTNVFKNNTVVSANRAVGGALSVSADSGSGGGFIITDNAVFDGNSVTVAGDVAAKTVSAMGSAQGGAISVANRQANITGATFQGNKVQANVTSASAESHAARGGAIGTNGSLYLTGKNTFTGNIAETTNGTASGGAVFVERNYGGEVFVIASTSQRDATVFDGNEAKATVAGGRAQGGAIMMNENRSGVLTDAQFTGNKATALTAGNAQGGAIYAKGDLTIIAQEQDVLFAGNVTTNAGVTTANDIHLALYPGKTSVSADTNPILTLNAAAHRQITLNGGVTGTGDIRVNYQEPTFGVGQFGTVDFTKNGKTDIIGDFSVYNEGTVKTAIVAAAGGYQSNVIARKDADPTKGGGLVEIANNVTWTVDTSPVANGFRGAVTVGEAGWAVSTSSPPGSDGRAQAQAALDRGNTMYFGLLTAQGNAGEQATLGVDTTKVHVADTFVNSLIMHDASTVRSAAHGRIDHNFNRFRESQNGVVLGQKGCSLGASLWGNYIGRSTEIDAKHYLSGAGATLEKAKIASSGLQVGADLLATRYSQLGVLIGGENGVSRLGKFDEVKSDDYYFGVYGARRFSNGIDLRGSLGFGYQKYDMQRLQLLGLAADRGVYNARFSGKTFESTLEIGRRFSLRSSQFSPQLSLRPVLGFDLYNNAIDSATEFSGTANEGLTYHGMSLTQTHIRAGSDVQWLGDWLNLSGGMYYLYDMSPNGHTLRGLASRGGASNVVLGSDLGRSVLRFQVGTNYFLNHAKTVNLFADYSGDYFADRAGKPMGHTAIAGAQVRF